MAKKIIRLYNDAHIDGYADNFGYHTFYSALAYDDGTDYDTALWDNADYEIIWGIIEEDCEDESNACDWYTFDVYDHFGSWIGDDSTYEIIW